MADAAEQHRDLFGDSDKDNDAALTTAAAAASGGAAGAAAPPASAGRAAAPPPPPGAPSPSPPPPPSAAAAAAAGTGPPLHLSAPLAPPLPLGSRWLLLRTSNVFGVRAAAFHPDTHALEAPFGPGGELANVARWRLGPDGVTPQSNARLVRWSDGTLQLQLGAEVLDVDERPPDAAHSVLLERHPGLMAPCGAVAGRLVLRPSSLASRSHRLLAASLEARHARGVRVRKTVTTADPGAGEAAAARDEARAARGEGGAGGGGAGRRRGGGGVGVGGGAAAALTRGFLEDGAAPLGAGGDAAAPAPVAGGRGEKRRVRARGGGGGQGAKAGGGGKRRAGGGAAAAAAADLDDDDDVEDGDYSEDDRSD